MTASMRRGMLCISCWHSWGVTSFQQVLMASFSCSQVFGWCLCNYFFTIPHKFSMGLKWGELAGQSNTCTWQFSHHACVDFAVRWSKILLEDELVISKELIGSWHHEIFQDILVNCCINRRLEEAEVTNTSWWHRPPPPQTITDCGNFTFRLRQPSVFRSCSVHPFSSTLWDLCGNNKRNNKLGLVGKHDWRPLLCRLSSFFFLLSAPLQPLLSLSAIEQRFYSWYTAAETLFMQPFDVLFGQMPPLHHSSLLPHPSQSLGAAKPVLLSQSDQLAVISLRGRPFPATVLPIAAHISKAFRDSRLGNSKLSCYFHLLNAIDRKQF